MYRSTLIKTDVIGSATVALTQNQFTKIGEVVVPADMEIGMGYGDPSSQSDAEGRIYANFRDSVPADVNGRFRIQMLSSQDQPLADSARGISSIVLDIDCEALRTGSNDRPAQIPFKFQGALLTRDKKFAFYIMCRDAAKTLSQANSTVVMDITRNLL